MSKRIPDYVAVRIPKKYRSQGSLDISYDFTPFNADFLVQHGEVVEIPSMLTEHFFSDNDVEIDIEVGDRVYVHHHAHDGHDIEEDIKAVLYENIFARVRDGEIKALSPYVLLKQVEDVEQKLTSGLAIGGIEKHVPLKATVAHTCDEALREGVKNGDTVYFKPKSENRIMVEGEIYIVTTCQRILIAVEDV